MAPGETTATYHRPRGRETKSRTLDEIKVPDSLGRAYSEFTEYLGFMPNNDEYKVMGLASYGEPEVRSWSPVIRRDERRLRARPRACFYRYSYCEATLQGEGPP